MMPTNSTSPTAAAADIGDSSHRLLEPGLTGISSTSAAENTTANEGADNVTRTIPDDELAEAVVAALAEVWCDCPLDFTGAYFREGPNVFCKRCRGVAWTTADGTFRSRGYRKVPLEPIR
jgi:hypothetical protein